MLDDSDFRVVLTLNAGSSSIKIGVFSEQLALISTGLIDRIGDDGSLHLKDAGGMIMVLPDGLDADFSNHDTALTTAIAALEQLFAGLRVVAVGHRVVHGGIRYATPVTLDADIMAQLTKLEPFAPLHQPHNLAGIRAAAAAFPDAIQVACFDTAFHRGHALVNDAFALPRAYYDKGVRRYGFHGISYDYIAGALREQAPELAAGRVVVAHLGNGASMCGMRAGRSVSSSMGFSTLDGLAMGTRCGQLDPGVILYLLEQEGMGAEAISDLLYRQSGLLGMSGLSNDMRRLEQSADPRAAEAIDYFVSRVQRELGGMAADLQGLDALVFCVGIGENSRTIRARVAAGMGWLGLELAPARNAENGPVISAEGSRVKVMVIPTDEELVIARATRSALMATGRISA